MKIGGGCEVLCLVADCAFVRYSEANGCIYALVACSDSIAGSELVTQRSFLRVNQPITVR